MEDLEKFLSFIQELSVKSEEIGRLKAEAEMKDRLIAGLTAQLSVVVDKQVVDTSKSKQVSNVNLSDIVYTSSSSSNASDIINEDVQAPVEIVSEPVKTTRVSGRKVGRPKLSEVKKSNTTTSEKVLKGGSVFKEFVPLELDNLVTQNSGAYMPPQKSNLFSIM